MVDHPEFFDYAERIQEQKLFGDHEKWQHSTLMGKLTIGVMNWARRSDFINSIINAFTDQEGGSSPNARVLSIGLTMSSVVIGVIATFAIGRIVQMIIGREIVVEQNVVIETQIKLSDLMKDDDGNDDADLTNEQNNGENDRRSKKSKVQ